MRGVRTGEIGKTQAVRDILLKTGRPMKISELQPAIERKLKQVVGKAKLYQLLATMIKDDELDSVGRGDDWRFYWFKRPVE